MILNNSTIRELILQPELRDSIKRLMLTQNHMEILALVSDKGLTSSELAKIQNTSVQSASQTLKNIHAKGYTLRKELKSSSGGIEFAYWVKDAYIGYLNYEECEGE